MPAGEGGSAFAIAADVADPNDVTAMVDKATTTLGGLDGLVFNVGIGAGKRCRGQWVCASRCPGRNSSECGPRRLGNLCVSRAMC
jgi:NAD(P)-dependent dehydrogenase (short-subunit alcohol dehydrogenase family)